MHKSFVFAIILVLFTSNNLSAQTAEDIVKHSIEARGGESKIDSIKSFVLTGTNILSGMEIKTKIYEIRPDSLRTESESDGQKVILVSNGKNAWVKIEDEVTQISVKLFSEKNIYPGMIIDGPFLNAAKEAKSVKYYLKDSVIIKKRKAYKIKMKMFDSTESHNIVCYISSDDHTLIKTVMPLNNQSPDNTVEIMYEEYRWIDGINFPHLITVANKHSKYIFKVHKLKLNPAIDIELFGEPKED
jgi:hypothetical protein